MPGIKEDQNVTLSWNVNQNALDYVNKKYHANKGKVLIYHRFDRVFGHVKLDSTGEYFLPNISILKLKNSTTNKILALFNLDVSDYANKMKSQGK